VHDTSRDLRFRAPSEGLLSNAEDLVKFGNALLNSAYFSEEIKKRMFEPVELANDMPSSLNNGWLVMTDENGRTLYGNIGAVSGGGAALIVYPEEKLVVACATNAGALNEDYPVFEIAAEFLTDTPKVKIQE
jgi:serine beta-lactamase-like protein LACTB, mitochondrial